MKKSMFQFKNPHIEKISFEINNNIPFEDDIPLGINVQTCLSDEENMALVKLTLTVGKIDEDSKQLKNSIYFERNSFAVIAIYSKTKYLNSQLWIHAPLKINEARIFNIN